MEKGRYGLNTLHTGCSYFFFAVVFAYFLCNMITIPSDTDEILWFLKKRTLKHTMTQKCMCCSHIYQEQKFLFLGNDCKVYRLISLTAITAIMYYFENVWSTDTHFYFLLQDITEISLLH